MDYLKKMQRRTQAGLLMLFTATACTLLSCRSGTRKIRGASGSSKTPSSLTDFKPIIQGVWVKKDYIDQLTATKSPAAAATLASGITCVYFDTHKITGDSLLADAVFNNHEGGSIILYNKPGKHPHTLRLAEDNIGYTISSLGYHIAGKDTLLVIHHTEQGKTTAISFVKALNK